MCKVSIGTVPLSLWTQSTFVQGTIDLKLNNYNYQEEWLELWQNRKKFYLNKNASEKIGKVYWNLGARVNGYHDWPRYMKFSPQMTAKYTSCETVTALLWLPSKPSLWSPVSTWTVKRVRDLKHGRTDCSNYLEHILVAAIGG